MSMDYTRQEGILPTEMVELTRVTLIGAGGIGSPTALALAKMGIKYITMYDPDTVEPHNLPNQLYRKSDVGSCKVEALSGILWDFSDCTAIGIPNLYEGERMDDVTVAAVDSMDTRKFLWEQAKDQTPPIYIEARMGAEVARIYTVNPADSASQVWYEQFLYSDQEALDVPCTARATIYCVFMIASLIASQVKKYVMGQRLSAEIVCDLVTNTMFTSGDYYYPENLL